MWKVQTVKTWLSFILPYFHWFIKIKKKDLHPYLWIAHSRSQRCSPQAPVRLRSPICFQRYLIIDRADLKSSLHKAESLHFLVNEGAFLETDTSLGLGLWAGCLIISKVYNCKNLSSLIPNAAVRNSLSCIRGSLLYSQHVRTLPVGKEPILLHLPHTVLWYLLCFLETKAENKILIYCIANVFIHFLH